MNRLGFLGASDFPAVLGLSRWKTPKQLFLEKTEQAPEQPRSLRLDIGNVLEPLILDRAQAKLGPITLRGLEIHHPEEPWLRVHPDGLTTDGRSVVQAKTCAFAKRDEGWGAPGSADIPAGYFAQVQVEMLVARADGRLVERAFLAVLLLNRLGDENNPQIFEVPFDTEMAHGLVERGREFWRCVESRTWPFQDESEAA